MNLTLTRRGDYALRAALYLAERWSDPAKTREIADVMALPPSYTPQVLGLLVQAGLVVSRSGPAGGYTLSRKPEAISVLEVVEAAEGSLLSTTCILRGGPCRWEDACAAHPAWSRASEAFRSELAATSLEDVAEADRRDRPSTRLAT
jgi:Rrf2 family protein